METQLRACPFCGGKAELLNGDPPIIRCVECFASIPGVYGETTDNLIEQWNTREMLEAAADIYDDSTLTNKEKALMLYRLIKRYNKYKY